MTLVIKMILPQSGVVLFSASWASEACQCAKQILEAACALNHLPLVEIVEEEGTEGIFDAMAIEAVPCVVRLSEGKEVGRVTGADSQSILRLLSVSTSVSASVSDKSMSNNINKTTQTTQTTQTTHTTQNLISDEELKELVGRSKLMLFIKGTPSEPRCGFTSQLIRLLSENGLKSSEHYATFNILENQGVREALKVWAQWPTYPQVYWKGELIGGLDILKEMFSTGQMDLIISELTQ